VLIIDKVSMLSAPFFELIDEVGKAVRSKLMGASCVDKPFGGIQLILCSDFLQLVSVDKTNKKMELFSLKIFKTPSKINTTFGKKKYFCFQTRVWENANITCVELTKCFQQSDEVTVKMFELARDGWVSDETHSILIEVSKHKIRR
jgi:hypothetical protein